MKKKVWKDQVDILILAIGYLEGEVDRLRDQLGEAWVRENNLITKIEMLEQGAEGLTE